MALPSDDLNHQHLVEIHRKIDLLLKVVARQQDQLARLAKVRSSDPNYRTRKYLRDLVHRQREDLGKQKLYILQLENELKLRGLE